MANKKPNNKQSLANKLRKFRGYKFYRDLGDGSFDIVRYSGSGSYTSDKKDYIMNCIDENGKSFEINYSILKEYYTPLNPEGIMSFNIVDVATPTGSMKDVVVVGYKNIELALGVQDPFFICRQSINDFFADLEFNDPKDNHFVGVSVTRDNCPTNVEFMSLMKCSGISRSDVVNIYKDDCIDDILKCVPVEKYDAVLENLYQEHTESIVLDPIRRNVAKEIDGWCRKLPLLLQLNNVMSDLNYMNGIIGVDFVLSNYLNSRDNGVKELNDISRLFLSEVIKCNIKESRVIEYNYSLDMSKFNNDNYILIRDKNNKVYLVVYLAEGEFLEEELQKEISKLSITDSLRLAYYNKYKGGN